MVKRRAFTLIELLVVIAIIALLMGMVVGAIGYLREQARRTRTRAVLAIAGNGLAASGAVQAQNLDAVEHPLAASADQPMPRPRFLRRADGGAIPTVGDAIRAADPAEVAPADRDRILRDDDVHADPAAPHLIGMPRWRLAVLGVTTRWVSRWRRITGPGQPGVVVEPELGTWVDEGFRRAIVADPADPAWDASADRAMGVALGAVQDELLALGGLWRPDPARDPLLAGGRLRRDASPGAAPAGSAWQPGTVLEGTAWMPYRLRGPSLIDAWGREVLAARTPSGAVRLESAGRDGCFRFHPGADRVLATDALADAVAGDDRDARADNIAIGPER